MNGPTKNPNISPPCQPHRTNLFQLSHKSLISSYFISSHPESGDKLTADSACPAAPSACGAPTLTSPLLPGQPPGKTASRSPCPPPPPPSPHRRLRRRGRNQPKPAQVSTTAAAGGGAASVPCRTPSVTAEARPGQHHHRPAASCCRKGRKGRMLVLGAGVRVKRVLLLLLTKAGLGAPKAEGRGSPGKPGRDPRGFASAGR